MDMLTWFFLISFGVIILTVIIFFTIFIVKKSRQKLRITTYFWPKKATVNFRIFDLNITHNFLVWRKKEYEVVYDLLTEQGEIGFSIDQQIKIKTTSRKSGSVIIKFNRFTPTFSCKGVQAKNGYCKVRLYRKK